MNRAKILIVEDEAIIAMEIESSLQNLGYEATSIVDSGEKAIRNVEKDKPDLILMDIQIKGKMDGIETAGAIQDRFGIPVIFLTSHVDDAKLRRVKKISPFGYLTKPFRESDLKATIKIALYLAEQKIARLKAEKQLRESEEKYRGLTQLANSVILRLDANQCIVFLNDYGLEFFEYTEQELIGQSIVETLVPKTESTGRNLQQMIDDVFRSPEEYIENENENVTKSGKRIWVSWKNKALFAENGEFSGFLCTGINITKRKETENALKKRVKELNCLYGMSSLIEEAENSLQDMLNGSISLLQQAMQFPDLCEIKLNLDNDVFQTDNWKDVPQKISRDIWVNGKIRGVLEIGYLSVTQKYTNQMFIPEENSLLSAIAERIGKIVERIQTREELFLLSTKYQELFNRMSSGVVFYRAINNDGTDFIFSDINKAGEMIDNVKREDLIDKNVLSVFPGVKNMGLLDVFQRVWRTGESESHPVTRYNDDRIMGWRENHILKLPSGEIVAIYDDKTVEMQAREEMEIFLKEKGASEAKYRNLYHFSPDIYLSIDISTGTIVEYNHALERLTGYSDNQVIEQSFTRLLDEESTDRFINELLPKLTETGKIENAELKLICLDGSVLDINLKISTFNGPQEGAGLALAVLRDDTKKKILAEEHVELEKKILHLQKLEAIGALAGGIAHDFNNILHPIMGYARLAKRQVQDNPKIVGYLDQINSSANRARQLIQEILTFSNPGKQAFAVIDLQAIVKETLHFIKTSLPRSIEVLGKLDKECGNILGNPTQMHQILMNLMTNAYHALENSGGQLIVELNPVDANSDEWFLADSEILQGISLKVSDTGEGIDEQVLNRIFEPYFTTKESGKGTGLGLATVQGIVKAHGGDIRVLSQKDIGTTFHLQFPAVNEQADILETLAEDMVPIGTEHILLVDDEYKIVAMEKEILEDLGYKTTIRTGSIDALGAFKAHPDKYDMVITDMTMPNMDGADLAINLLEIRSDIPIIICTGFSDKINHERAAVIGVRKLMMKPVSMEQLAHAIREEFDSKKY